MAPFLCTAPPCAELLHFKLPDLHLEDGWLKVMGKGQKERIVPFGNRCARLLQRYINPFRPRNNGTHILFLNILGEPLTETAIASLFRRTARKANIPRPHIHLLRHTVATNYLIAGGDGLTLQRILRHETLEMTRQYVDQVASQVTVLRAGYSPLDRFDCPRQPTQKRVGLGSLCYPKRALSTNSGNAGDSHVIRIPKLQKQDD